MRKLQVEKIIDIDDMMDNIELPQVVNLEYEISAEEMENPNFALMFRDHTHIYSDRFSDTSHFIHVEKEKRGELAEKPELCFDYAPCKRKGMLITAEFLSRDEYSDEQKKLCLLHAILTDTTTDCPYTWHGEPYRLCTGLLNEVIKRFEYSSLYHHALRGLVPVYAQVFEKPKTEEIPQILVDTINKLNEEYVIFHSYTKQKWKGNAYYIGKALSNH